MKTISKLVLATLFSIGSSVHAQETPVTKPTPSLVPPPGSVMVEVGFKPFGNDKIINFDNFKGKWRINDQIALRLGLHLDNQTNKLTSDDYGSYAKNPTTSDEKSFTYGIMPGIEYHFLKNSKVSPYCGIELSYQRRNTSGVYEDYVEYSYNNYTYQKYTLEGAWKRTESYTFNYNGSTYSGTNITYDNQRSYHTVGSTLLMGSDFYFLKNMYFGFEVGLGYNYQKFDKITRTFTDNTDPIVIPSYNQSTTRFVYNNAIRLGIWW